MRKKKSSNRLVTILASIIAIVIFGVIISIFIKKEPKSSSNSAPNAPPSEKNPDNFFPNTGGKLSKQELEKYLTEKRLDLQKYFVFNLGKEVKAIKGNTGSWADDERPMNEKLAADLTKLADCYLKELEKHPEYEINRRFNKDYNGKDTLSFGKKCLEEWEGNQLNHKINKGENCYIVFEKNEPELYFYVNRKDRKKIIGLHEYVTIPIDSSSACQVFKSKGEAGNFLQKNDPALISKI